MTTDVEMIDSRRVEALAKAYDIAIKLIKDYLEGKDISEERVEVARITVTQWSRVRQTDNARAALNFMMERQLATAKPLLNGRLPAPDSEPEFTSAGR